MTEIICARLQGHSAAICGCRIPGGWKPCPPHALGMLVSVYPPASYRRADLGFAPQQKAAPAVSAASAAIQAGYTGSICDMCGSPRMRRSGTCETCDDCGAAGGCG